MSVDDDSISLEILEGAEARQPHHHRPALGCAVRAELGAHEDDLGLSVNLWEGARTLGGGSYCRVDCRIRSYSTTEGLGFSTCAARVAGTGVEVVALPPPTWLMSTMTIRTIATTATLEIVTTVGDCHGGRRSRVTDLAAAWLRRCFLVIGLAPPCRERSACPPACAECPVPRHQSTGPTFRRGVRRTDAGRSGPFPDEDTVTNSTRPTSVCTLGAMVGLPADAA